MNREEYDKVLKTGMFWEWFPNLSGEWEKDQEEFINELRTCRLDAPIKPQNTLTLDDLEVVAEYMINNAIPYMKGFIDLNIMQAQGYFVGEWEMVPETSGRRVLTKTGWKGVKDFVAKYSPESFRVTYNGVKYEIEDNEELFEKLFEHEL